MVIALYRRMVACNDVVRKGGTKDGLVGFELEGKKFGVIGTGAIGLRVAEIAKAFGCEVLAYSRTKRTFPASATWIWTRSFPRVTSSPSTRR